ncbi:MAG: HAD family hydrolase [Clostridiales bacterium]|jgi:putative hydrolase of the HAD superfamily|nr:HAD family hydrolase [Eubacteriales bacterium]MDH7566148.1 HAD family hydrolase [Clostridiales bacterium]
MKGIKYVFFDCMETLVDLTELPAMRDYALWAYQGSGVEGLWRGFEEFLEGYAWAKESLHASLAQYEECEMYRRLELAVRQKLVHREEKEIFEVSKRLYHNFWKTYRSKCYVKEDVKSVLPKLKERFPLGVVSNFMVEDGIEELLSQNGIIRFFDFVVTSIREGWRKPHPAIYHSALSKAGVLPEEVVFIGDDYVNDYVTPGSLGMKTVLLDRYGKHGGADPRVGDFYELMGILL